MRVGPYALILAGIIGGLALLGTLPFPELFLKPSRILFTLESAYLRVFYVVHFSLLTIGSLAGILGIYSLYQYLSPTTPMVRMLALGSMTFGLFGFAYGSLVNLFTFPRLGAAVAGNRIRFSDALRVAEAANDRTFTVVGSLGILFLVGMFLFGGVLLRTRALPKWTGLLGVAAPLVHGGLVTVGLLIPDRLPPLDKLWGLAPQLPEAPLALWFIFLGRAMLKQSLYDADPSLDRSPKAA